MGKVMTKVQKDEAGMQQVGLRVEDEAVAAVVEAPPALEPPLEDPGFVEFAAAGTVLVGEFRCADCGYGAVVQRLLLPCPMCGGTIWEQCGPLARHRID